MEERKTGDVIFSRDFLLCFLSYFLLWLSFDLFLLFPLFVMQRGGSPIDVGIQFAIFYLPSVVARPLAGRLIDKHGRLKMIWFGALVMSATGFALLALMHGNYQSIKIPMAVILFVRGTGYGAFFAAFFTYAADLSSPENRARVIGLFGVSGLIGSGLAPRMGEIIIAHRGFAGFFWAAGILAFLSLVIALFLRERKPHEETGEKESGWAAFRNVTFSRKNIVILPGAFIFGYVLASFSTFGAPYFEQLKVPSIGNYFLVYGLTAGLVRIVLGDIADRFPRQTLAGLFFLLQAFGVSLLVVYPVNAFYLAAAAVAGGSHGILFPCLNALAVDSHPAKNRGLITSVFSATLEAGFTSGSYILGYAVAFFGYRSMFLSVAVVGALFSVFTLVLSSRKRSAGA